MREVRYCEAAHFCCFYAVVLLTLSDAFETSVGTRSDANIASYTVPASHDSVFVP